MLKLGSNILIEGMTMIFFRNVSTSRKSKDKDGGKNDKKDDDDDEDDDEDDDDEEGGDLSKYDLWGDESDKDSKPEQESNKRDERKRSMSKSQTRYEHFLSLES